MSDIKIKCSTNDLKMKSKATFLPSGYLKPQGTLEVAALGLVDVTPYEKVNIKSAVKPNIHYGTDEPTDTKQLWVKKDFEPNKVIISDEGLIFDIVNTIPKKLVYTEAHLYENKIYFFGYNMSTPNIYCYDIEADTVTTLVSNGYSNTSSVLIGTKIYMFGGAYSGATRTAIRVYDIETNKITTLTTAFETSYKGSVSAVKGTKVYLLAGKINNSTSNKIQVFDTETETLETLDVTFTGATMENSAGAMVGSKVYLFGGSSGSTYQRTIRVFDTETETAETLTTTLKVATDNMAAVVVGTKIYLLGGYTKNGAINTIQVFDTETETLETLDTTLPEEMYGLAAVFFDNKIYFMGNSSDNIYSYTLELKLTENYLKLQTDTSNTFKLFDNNSFDIEIGVKGACVGNAENKGESVKIALHNGTNWVEI